MIISSGRCERDLEEEESKENLERERVGEDVAYDLLHFSYPLIDDDWVTINVYTSLSNEYGVGYR